MISGPSTFAPSEDYPLKTFIYNRPPMFLAQDWMKYLNNDTQIFDVTLPGTHDTGAGPQDYQNWFNFVQCQAWTISEQLQAGIRYFDIRVAPYYDKLKIYHGIIDLNLDFKDVMNDFVSFLKQFPSEFLFISLKKESGSDVEGPNNICNLIEAIV